MDYEEIDSDILDCDSTTYQKNNHPPAKWKIWKSWESKIQNIIVPLQSQTETQLWWYFWKQFLEKNKDAIDITKIDFILMIIGFPSDSVFKINNI